jgi:choline kinase
VPLPPTVVISCAGMATRLGMGMTKALIDICGKPLLHWQLAMLRDVEDVRVVVGHQAEQVIECTRAVRQDVTFVFNHAYASTGTAKSLCLAATGAIGDIVSLDGDLLVDPRDFRRFLETDTSLIGCLPISSSQPVLVEISTDSVVPMVTAFSMEQGAAEWSGLAKVPAKILRQANMEGKAEQHVYQILEPLLPLPALEVRATEVDTMDDYERALIWIKQYCGVWESL